MLNKIKPLQSFIFEIIIFKTSEPSFQGTRNLTEYFNSFYQYALLISQN